ncbi:MAG: amidohydrolase family protein [Coriobacteriales bacterium]|jgi:adenine deaminase|nr:amidohydrolase family protein [Coriobacteriales bacterium]
MDTKLLAVAGGQAPADLVITGGKLVNVYSGEVYEGGVAVSGERIAAIGDVAYAIGEGTRVIDAAGGYLTPGFIDGHIHPESSNLSIRPFAQAVLKHGTTAIMTDLHEIGVVGGLEAIEAVIAENEATHLKLYFVVPSHVPFSPLLETSGGAFNTAIIKRALARPDAVGLSEVVGHYILAGFPDLMDSLDAALAQPGKTIQGHLPDMSGPTLNTCLAAGVSTDHEALDGPQCIERLRNGCHVMLRESSAARTLASQLGPILEGGYDTSRLSMVCDDLHCHDAVHRGHMDELIRIALAAGLPFIKAIQMVTLNTARAFNLDQTIGGLAPGKYADINITTGPEDFRVTQVFAGGTQVVDNGELLVSYEAAQHNSRLLNTMTLKEPITAASFGLEAPEGARKVKVLAMDTLPWIPITTPREVVLDVVDGVIQCDSGQDVLYIAQVERYGKNGNVGKAFMGGFKLKQGALASSVGHDNHNIIVLGTNFEDMAAAVNRVVEIQGGQVVVDNGVVVAEVPYPVCGLLSDLSAEELSAQKDTVNAAIHERGCEIPIPFMFLSFICLAALPGFAITDKGFINVETQQVIDPVLGVEA